MGTVLTALFYQLLLSNYSVSKINSQINSGGIIPCRSLFEYFFFFYLSELVRHLRYYRYYYPKFFQLIKSFSFPTIFYKERWSQNMELKTLFKSACEEQHTLPTRNVHLPQFRLGVVVELDHPALKF